MKTLGISWRGHGAKAHYFVNGRTAGQGDAGFDAVLAQIRKNRDAAVVIYDNNEALGGESLHDSTPFAAQFPKLLSALGDRELQWSTR